MASPIILPVDDKDLDDAALWAVIDSAAASYSTTLTTTPPTGSAFKSRKPLTLKPSNCRTPQILPPYSSPSPLQQLQKSSSKAPRYHHHHTSPNSAVPPRYGGEVLDNIDRDRERPQKISRSSYCVSEVSENSPLAVVRHAQVTRSPAPPVYSSPASGRFTGKEISPFLENLIPIDCVRGEDKDAARQIGLGGRVNTVDLFKEYQDTAMAILEKSDYTMISGNPYIKKSGWRKMAFFFNVSFEIKDKSIEFDENRNVQRAEFLVRAHMAFSDGWGSCERREKRFMKPNNDIPSTAETRAKNKACQDLLGIGEYRPSATRKP